MTQLGFRYRLSCVPSAAKLEQVASAAQGEPLWERVFVGLVNCECGKARRLEARVTMSEQIISRQAEEHALIDFLDMAPHRPCALVIEGDPGIGKTTMWLDAVARARDRGFRVLASRAAAAESVLAYCTLADLLNEVDDAIWAELPAPQQQGLDAATLRSPRRRARDRRAGGSGSFCCRYRSACRRGAGAVCYRRPSVAGRLQRQRHVIRGAKASDWCGIIVHDSHCRGGPAAAASQPRRCTPNPDAAVDDRRIASGPDVAPRTAVASAHVAAHSADLRRQPVLCVGIGA